jgi:hypothetical protein
LVRRGTELANLLEDEPSTFLFVPYLIVFVHDDEEIGLFFAGSSEEFLGGVVLSGDDKDHDVYLLLPSEEGCGLQAVTVETRGVDERNIDDNFVE